MSLCNESYDLLYQAIKQYTKASYKDVGNKKFILLICDGDMEYNKDIVDLAKYAIGIEIIKIYQLLTGQTYDVSINRRRPYLVSC